MCASITADELWRRLENFLREVLPVAEESNVKLALHPDDPPMPTMRGQPRLVYQSHLYQKLIDLNPSPANTLEFCLGTLAEMIPQGRTRFMKRRSATARRAGWRTFIFETSAARFPYYKETFVDDGDVDMVRVLRILKRNKFNGLLIPDHTPQMSCGAPWHAGMAYALGYMRAALQKVEGE